MVNQETKLPVELLGKLEKEKKKERYGDSSSPIRGSATPPADCLNHSPILQLCYCSLPSLLLFIFKGKPTRDLCDSDQVPHNLIFNAFAHFLQGPQSQLVLVIVVVVKLVGDFSSAILVYKYL